MSNAAIAGSINSVLDPPMAQWDEVHRVNVIGPLTLIKELVPQLIGRPGANTVIVSSLRGLSETPMGEPYSSANACPVRHPSNSVTSSSNELLAIEA